MLSKPWKPPQIKVGCCSVACEDWLRDRQAVAVVVTDSGPGIDKDKLDGIFTAFVSTKRYGTGLGLAICRMIIEYHGGKLSASSDSKDGGASFEFVLPIVSIA